MPRSHNSQKPSRQVRPTQLTTVPNSLSTSTPNPQRPSFFQTMKEGVAFGVGNSIGQSIFRSIFTGSTAPPVDAPMQPPKQQQQPTPEYLQCMIDNFNDKEACKEYK